MWDVEYTDEFESWWMTLTQSRQEALDDRIMLLAQEGPYLGRPVVGKIASSRHASMKELRAANDRSLRVLFAFDPRRRAILPLGGDKAGRWNRWYDWAIPLADLRYDTHLRELTDEGLLDGA